jgi:hypothetical protein
MTSAQQELAQSGKPKAEIVLTDGTFVTIYPTKMKHILVAQDPDQLMYGMKIIAAVTKFDDEPPTAHQVMNLDPKDYNYIMKYIIK